MNEAQQKLSDLFEAFAHTSESMDHRMVSIMTRRAEYEKSLDSMWENFLAGYVRQAMEYRAQVRYIKDAGLEVLRSKSTGKHEITYKRR